MLLAIDIGNTMTHYGLFKGDRLVRHGCIETGHFQGPTLKIGWEMAVVCSVVPKVKLRLGVPTLFVTPNLDLGLKVYPKNPGADRLANAVAVKFLYGYPALVVDFGTAITIDVVSKKGDYLGGVIMPGLNMIRYGLYEKTALLPLVKVEKPKKILGQNTEDAIKSGIYYGIKGMVEQLIYGLKKELRFPKKTVIISTGGYSELLGVGKIDKFLTLKGLRIIYERNTDNRSAFICK